MRFIKILSFCFCFSVPVVYLRRDSNGKVFSPGLAASPDPGDREGNVRIVDNIHRKYLRGWGSGDFLVCQVRM